MKIELLIREATASDLDPVYGLRRQLYEDDACGAACDIGPGNDALAELLNEPGFGRLWVGFLGTEMAGYVLVTFSFSLEFKGRNAFVDELVVDRRIRGQGIGEELLAFAEDWARGAGIKAVHLEVTPSNVAAASLYRKRGYLRHERELLTRWM
ncbi:MAG: GNAT family N-acetyltransferase [Planctomycetota bacterium]|nr:GNAT family N-acetyltransferase [Planctomycetota bacterium]